jgi:hypothetical protein
MSQTAAKNEFPSLFNHRRRAGWGVAVLSGERDGKRWYLFEDGEERVLGIEGIALMRRVEKPDSDQQATHAHLMSLLAKRKRDGDAPEPPGAAAVLRQLERFRKKYQGGFFGQSWRKDEKGVLARRSRAVAAPRVQAELGLESLQELVSAQRFDAVWEHVEAALSESGLASTSKLRATPKSAQRLAETILDLLHGQDRYELRFDRLIEVYQSIFGEAPSWQTATALPALMFPEAHVYVEPTSFRKQLKAMARWGAFAPYPNGAAYGRCLGMAQALANMLAVRGEVPRDLMDVHDFIRATA